jgi:hypothetical protein
VSGVQPEAGDARPPLWPRVVRAGLRTAFGYGLLVWAYIAVNALTHPETLARPLTHFLPWPLEGDTALACFLLSAVAFLLLRATRAERSETERGTR